MKKDKPGGKILEILNVYLKKTTPDGGDIIVEKSITIQTSKPSKGDIKRRDAQCVGRIAFTGKAAHLRRGQGFAVCERVTWKRKREDG